MMTVNIIQKLRTYSIVDAAYNGEFTLWYCAVIGINTEQTSQQIPQSC